MKRLIGAATLVCVASCGGGSPSAPSAPGNPGAPGSPGTPGAAAIALSGNLAFGGVLVGASATSTLTISNPGTAALTVTGVTGPNGFTPSWTSGTIAAGASQAVAIGFAPTTAGDYGGTVTVNANQSSGTNTMGISGAAYPSMNGAWTGTHISTGAGQSVTCNLSWTATGQTGSQFSGTWQLSGSGCGQTGTFSGNVSTSSAITGVTFNALVGASTCTRVSGDGLYNGALSGNGVALQSADTIRCLGVEIARANRVSLTRQ
jgi:hypothetical protein